MRHRTDLPRDVREVENTWIPMSDGTRLAARMWLPEGADHVPVPAVLEYIPYRKRDRTRARDTMDHSYLAAHGYACLRVDMRGSGDSDGILTDEYLQQELDDGIEVLAWIGRQGWCTGAVGMMGISWGGFNALQVAALQPPELEGVVTVCSTDDRYADDVHYMGGCLLGDNLSWASVMFHRNTIPPDPELVGDRWREMWVQRLAGSGLWLDTWLRHQRRDAYWRHGSVCEDYSRIRCPVMAVSGWADGYSNAVFRLVENLEVRCSGLIGPWSHRYPHLGEPGPAIGFLQELVRWWDLCLKDRDSGIGAEAPLRVWMQDSVPPSTHYDERPGRWIAEEAWPSPRIEPRRLALAARSLVAEDHHLEERSLTVRSPLRHGLYAGKWCAYAAPPDLPGDQREEDGGALVFESEPLGEPLEIMGAPELELELAVDRPVAMVAARLSDVRPDHAATRVTYGVLNLTHRDSHARPEPMVPGRRERVRVRLNHVAQRFPVGHRLRLSISTSYWPLAWPPPEPVELTVFTGVSALILPERPPRDADAGLRPFDPPEAGPAERVARLGPPEHGWKVTRDLATDTSTLEVLKDEGVRRIEAIDLEVRERVVERYTARGDDLDSLRGETHWMYAIRRGDWSIRTETRTVLTSTPTEFLLHAQLDAWEGDRRIESRNWQRTIPRDLV